METCRVMDRNKNQPCLPCSGTAKPSVPDAVRKRLYLYREWEEEDAYYGASVWMLGVSLYA